MSTTDDLIPLLKKLRLSGVLQSLELRTRQAADDDLSHGEFLFRLLCPTRLSAVTASSSTCDSAVRASTARARSRTSTSTSTRRSPSRRSSTSPPAASSSARHSAGTAVHTLTVEGLRPTNLGALPAWPAAIGPNPRRHLAARTLPRQWETAERELGSGACVGVNLSRERGDCWTDTREVVCARNQ